MRFRILAALCAAMLSSSFGASAQDVEFLGERYGTRPPGGYFETRAADPGAFQFSRGRTLRLRQQFQQSQGPAGGPGILRILGPRQGPVEGTYDFPVLLGLFSDSPEGVVPFPRDDVQMQYFGAAPGTITAYYDEVSGGKVTLLGEVQDWTRSALTQAQTTGGQSGLTSGTVGPFIADLLEKLPERDWGVFDNDGPDGIPNSGDDDGFVDVLAVLHPTTGAECNSSGKEDRIWSHRWSLRSARRYPDNKPYATTTPAANGGVVKIDDYVIQPVYACNGEGLNEIGVFTHELGHAFGLPDLYDTYDGDGKTAGAGNWDLMSSGAYGCNGSSFSMPCHMGAWSKAVLGWVEVVEVPDGVDLGTVTLPPVETSHQVYRVNARDGSGEYFLLENRQPLGFDLRLYEAGLLVWQISPSIVSALWPINGVNGFKRMGVWLRQADGLNQLGIAGGGRGDPGDPFPYTKGAEENRVFHASSNPSSVSEDGTPSGVTLVDIRRAGDDVTFRLLTRDSKVTVRSEGAEAPGGLFTLNGAAVPEAAPVLESPPFVLHTVEASAGESLGPGKRRPFLGWEDDAAASRTRDIETPLEDTVLVARYGGTQVELAVEVEGGVNGVAPGRFVTQPAAPDLWFAEGTTLTLEAVATRGFSFRSWSGALAGQPNPATLTLNGPTAAGASFDFTYGVPSAAVSLSAATDPQITLQPENGTYPYDWTVLSGTLPSGIELDAGGSLRGAAMETGEFTVSVRVRDGLGLTAEGTITLAVTDPVLPVERIASRFLLKGPQMSVAQLQYLDLKGNADGTYDLGDFRAWILAHPDLPLTAEVLALVGPRTVVVPLLPNDPGEVRR
ncbi:MAG TPA: M6 family metalloprotease domain-containing protein [Longimicrobiales bacterium]|nr:M6 family metalloprotease domain-containing protein [Longimicrobiales bacterium]